MIQNFLAMGGWLFFFMVIERSGEHPLAISNIARSIYIMLMIPLWAFGTTANTIVSNLIGEGKQHLVLSAIKRISLMSFFITLIITMVAAFMPREILSLYTSNERLINDSIPVLYVVFAALLAFSAVITVYSGVTGTGNTFMGMWIEVVTIFSYMVFVFIVVSLLHQPVTIAWFSEFVYFIIMGTLSFLYLRYGKWRQIKI
jgi:Na+-driven multidrug efflux pump